MTISTRITQDEYNQYRKDDDVLILSIHFKKWLNSLRWVPKTSEMSDDSTQIKIDIISKRTFQNKRFIISSLKIDQSSFFLPLSIIEISPDKSLNIEEKCFLKLVNKQDQSSIVCRQAEYDKDFWKEYLNQENNAQDSQISRKAHFLTFNNNRDYFSQFHNPNWELKTLGEGDTTNIVLKFSFHNAPPMICKIYKQITFNLEVENLKHLSKLNFPNIPKLYFLLKIPTDNNRNAQILFREYNSSNRDTGSVFWNEFNQVIELNLNNTESKDQNEERWKEFITKNFPESIKYSIKIGKACKKLHELLSYPLSEDTIDFKPEIIEPAEILELQNRIIELFHNISSIPIEELGFINSFKKYFDKILISKISFNKQRIHQDLHLGQMLVSDDKQRDPIILDLEGDPQFSKEEKLKKYSPMQDLASIKRAFSYIKYNSLVEYIKKQEKVGSLKINHELVDEKNKNSKERLLSLLALIKLQSIINPVIREFFEKLLIRYMEIIYDPEISKHDFDMKQDFNNVFSGNAITLIHKKFELMKNWDWEMNERIWNSYFSYDATKFKDSTLFNLFLLCEIKRVLLEMKYEKKFRPENQIIPLLGLIDIFENFQLNKIL